MVGLPAAGKTTYLAALWYLGTAAAPDVAYRVDRLEGDLKYLNAMGRAWLECSEVPHTSVSSSESPVLSMVDTATGAATRLNIPDLSGEVFSHAIHSRRWDPRIAEPANAADGLLIFVNPGQLREPAWVFERPTGGQPEGPQPIAWSADLLPTQVQLVDLLQSVKYLRSGRVCPVAVIVSAWDEVASFYDEPSVWLSERLPLLDQYLATNARAFPNKLFGVSAQGGPLPGSEAALLDKKPFERPFIVEGLARSEGAGNSDVARSAHDLSAPVRWLIP